ncbi:MAG TPA: nuclear transport factor 2 family protein [Gammaproteobacteria bacterium]
MSRSPRLERLLLLPLLLVAFCARAERYPEGYADDRAAIVDLQARYVMAMDYFDADGYAAVFAPDGVLDWARGIVEGREAIREFMASRTYDLTRGAAEAKTPDGRDWPSTVRHLITNQVIEVDGDKARALTYWIQFNNNADRTKVEWMLFGSWYDEFVKIDGEWFFSLHRIHNEGNPRTFTAGQENPVKQFLD